MSHAITHPVNKTAHTGINQFHVASRVSGYGPPTASLTTRPPGCPYFCTDNNGKWTPNNNCSSTCPDGRCASYGVSGPLPSRCPTGTYLAGSCPDPYFGCNNPNP